MAENETEMEYEASVSCAACRRAPTDGEPFHDWGGGVYTCPAHLPPRPSHPDGGVHTPASGEEPSDWKVEERLDGELVSKPHLVDAAAAERLRRVRTAPGVEYVITPLYSTPATPVGMTEGERPSLEAVLAEAAVWQNATFTSATHASKAAHLYKEAQELRDAPTDPEEMADVALLLGHLADGAGVDLAAAVLAKLMKNQARTWGKPNAEGYVEHVREAEPLTTDTIDVGRATAALRRLYALHAAGVFTLPDEHYSAITEAAEALAGHPAAGTSSGLVDELVAALVPLSAPNVYLPDDVPDSWIQFYAEAAYRGVERLYGPADIDAGQVRRARRAILAAQQHTGLTAEERAALLSRVEEAAYGVYGVICEKGVIHDDDALVAKLASALQALHADDLDLMDAAQDMAPHPPTPVQGEE